MASRDWYSKKPYLHFDVPLSRNLAERLVTDPDQVASHAFYPFLTYDLIKPRMEWSDLLQRYVPANKTRPISYPAHKDGYIFAYYKSCLQQQYEQWVLDEELGDSITAFRSMGENNITLAKKAFDYIASKPSSSVVVADVDSFFPSVDHALLKKAWCRFLGAKRLPKDHFSVYKAATHYAEVERHKAYNKFRIPLHGNGSHGRIRICTPHEFRTKIAGHLTRPNPDLPSGKRIPQGSPLSPLLSNMYMSDFDLSMHKWVTSFGGSYWRYCDDILIVAPIESDDIIRRLDKELASVALNRNTHKTHIYPPRSISASKPLQYLGFMYDGFHVTVRSSSIHRYHRKLKNAVRAAQYRRQRETETTSVQAPLRKRVLYRAPAPRAPRPPS